MRVCLFFRYHIASPVILLTSVEPDVVVKPAVEVSFRMCAQMFFHFVFFFSVAFDWIFLYFLRILNKGEATQSNGMVCVCARARARVCVCVCVCGACLRLTQGTLNVYKSCNAYVDPCRMHANALCTSLPMH